MEALVNLQTVFYLRTTVDYGAVVAVSDQLTDTACRHLSVFLLYTSFAASLLTRLDSCALPL